MSLIMPVSVDPLRTDCTIVFSMDGPSSSCLCSLYINHASATWVHWRRSQCSRGFQRRSCGLRVPRPEVGNHPVAQSHLRDLLRLESHSCAQDSLNSQCSHFSLEAPGVNIPESFVLSSLPKDNTYSCFCLWNLFLLHVATIKEALYVLNQHHRLQWEPVQLKTGLLVNRINMSS